jgi:hypothetical protein
MTTLQHRAVHDLEFVDCEDDECNDSSGLLYVFRCRRCGARPTSVGAPGGAWLALPHGTPCRPYGEHARAWPGAGPSNDPRRV